MKKILQINIILMMLFMFISPVSALNDGAYLVSRSTSYTNPLTGKTEDGVENIALGESMVSNIVESQLLVEQINGKYYITVGLGLASNVSNVRFKVMTSSGSMSSVSATKTGSSSANGDTVNHYRLQVSSLELYISPIMYVNPTTNQTTQEETTEETQTPETTEIQQAIVGTITKESLMENATGLSNHIINSKGKVDKKLKLTVKNLKQTAKESTTKKDNTLLIVGICIVFILGGIFYVKKIKK